MYIGSINISNVRCFDQLSVEFNYPGKAVDSPIAMPNINLLLGSNGSGKTTLMKSIALATLGPIMKNSGYVPYWMIRRPQKGHISTANVETQVLLHEQDTRKKQIGPLPGAGLSLTLERIRDVERISITIESNVPSGEMYDNNSPAFFIVGYGASRRVEASANFDATVRSKSRLLRYQRVAGLFEEHVTLVPLSAWLPHLKSSNRGRHRQVVNLMNRLLPDGTRLLEKPKDGEYYFEHSGISVPFGALSDGYRSYIGWIADLLHHICMGCPSGEKLVDNAGVVLVDEVDLHLHPEWQREVVPRLSKVLPKLQFVLTTHSPIVVGSIEKANVFYFDSEPDGANVVRRPEEETMGLNAEQILVGEAFGLDSTRSEVFLDELKLVSIAAQKGQRGASLLYARMLNKGTAALTAPEQPAEELPDWVSKSQSRLKKVVLAKAGAKKTGTKKAVIKRKTLAGKKKPVAK